MFKKSTKPLTRPEDLMAPPVNIPPAPQVIITGENEYRPCYANGRRALFHRWINTANPVLPNGSRKQEGGKTHKNATFTGGDPMVTAAHAKLLQRLPNLSPDEEKVLCEALEEMYHRGQADAKENLCKGCSYKAYYSRVACQNDCNDCGSARTCKHRPRAGEIVRINCPLWRPK